jgi:hypothetical protein
MMLDLRIDAKQVFLPKMYGIWHFHHALQWLPYLKYQSFASKNSIFYHVAYSMYILYVDLLIT